MSIYYIYAYLNENGTPYYVGKGKGQRAYHKRRGVILPDKKTNIVFLESELEENESLTKEKEYIKKYGRLDLGTGTLVNKTAGGQGISGHKFSEETIKKFQKNNKGTGNPMYGRSGKLSPQWRVKPSKETIRKISEASKRMWLLKKQAMTAI